MSDINSRFMAVSAAWRNEIVEPVGAPVEVATAHGHNMVWSVVRITLPVGAGHMAKRPKVSFGLGSKTGNGWTVWSQGATLTGAERDLARRVRSYGGPVQK
jgi:hypothetical protein